MELPNFLCNFVLYGIATRSDAIPNQILIIDSIYIMNNPACERIAALRTLMREAGISAVIIPQSDPHLSEYISDHAQARRWFSGFTGSAGALVVTTDKAFVWADSRYWLQAEAQLEGTGIGVMKEGLASTPSIEAWLTQTLPAGSTVGIDGMIFSAAATQQLRSALAARSINLITDFDPVDTLWTDRPALPSDKVFIHDEQYAGESVSSKLSKVIDNARAQGADAAFISDLAEVAWTLNIRSRDVESNPVVTAYLLVSPNGSRLFVNPDKLTPEVSAYLSSAGVTTAPYDSVKEALTQLTDDLKVLICPSQTPEALSEALGSRKVDGTSPITMLKAVKNATQIAGVRNAMIRDGVALVKSFMEIEQAVETGETITEMDVADILTRHRSAQPLYFDQSFDTIAGFGPHGAIVHYSANPSTNSDITAGNLLLIDSGANYLDGTTDITRTIALGTPTEDQQHDFTLVLKGHISLATAVFPEGTCGMQLDVLARLPLWKDGKTYLHGTGHGVGHFLNVHEGPQRIHLTGNPAPLMPGMITSDEPGLYLAGRYGIRTENLVLTTEAFTTEFGRFFHFEVLTLFPYDLTLVDFNLLSPEESLWLQRYHQRVYRLLSPHLNDQEREWLREKCGI